MTCPICQKAGINDEALICPQCNSDLSQFHLINRIENNFGKWKKLRLFSILSFTIILIAFVVIIISSESNNTKKTNSDFTTTKIPDSTKHYKNKFFLASKMIDSLKTSNPPSVIIKYKVKQGDNLSDIAYMFYNDVSKIKLLAEQNGLQNPNMIVVNQILKIEIEK